MLYIILIFIVFILYIYNVFMMYILYIYSCLLVGWTKIGIMFTIVIDK